MSNKQFLGTGVFVIACIFGATLFLHSKINEPKEEHPRCLSALFECDKQRKHLRELNKSLVDREQRWKKKWVSRDRDAKAWMKQVSQLREQAAQCVNKKISIEDNQR